MMKKALYLALLSILIFGGLLAVVSCGSSSATTPATTPTTNTQVKPPAGGTTGPDFKPAAVTIKDFAFSPETLTVSIGTTVTWTNEDSVSHIINERTLIFDSGMLARGKSYSFTFNEAGNFEYYCTIHPTMVGHIIVK